MQIRHFRVRMPDGSSVNGRAEFLQGTCRIIEIHHHVVKDGATHLTSLNLLIPVLQMPVGPLEELYQMILVDMASQAAATRWAAL